MGRIAEDLMLLTRGVHKVEISFDQLQKLAIRVSQLEQKAKWVEDDAKLGLMVRRMKPRTELIRTMDGKWQAFNNYTGGEAEGDRPEDILTGAFIKP